MTTSFGPTAIATPANAVTVARLLIAPLAFAMISDGPGWLIFWMWFGLCVTDGIDGYLARRHGTTRSGAFLDPLADKVLVLGAMFALVGADRFWWLPVALIAARELVISLYRTYAARRGVTVPARRIAKLKTLCQQLSVGLALMPPTAGAHWLWKGLLWVSVVLALYSGGEYLLTARAHARRQLTGP